MSAPIEIPVGLKNRAFHQGLDSMRNAGKSFATDMSKIGSKVAGAFAVSALVTQAGQLIEKFDRVQDLSERFDQSAESIQRVEGVTEQYGVNIETVAKAMSKMTIAANDAASGNENYSKMFEALNINAAEFRDMPIEQKILALSDAYKAANGDGYKTAQLMELLGGRAQDLLPVLAQGREALEAQFKDIPVLADDAVKKLGDLADAWTRMKTAGGVAAGWLITKVADLVTHLSAAAAMVGAVFGGSSLQEAGNISHELTSTDTGPAEPENWGRSGENKTYSDPEAAAEDAKAAKTTEDKKAKEQEKLAAELSRLWDEVLDKQKEAAFAAASINGKILQTQDEIARAKEKENDYDADGLRAKSERLTLEAKLRDLIKDRADKAKKERDEAAGKEEKFQDKLKAYKEKKSDADKEASEALAEKKKQDLLNSGTISADSIQSVGGGGSFNAFTKDPALVQKETNTILQKIYEKLPAEPTREPVTAKKSSFTTTR